LNGGKNLPQTTTKPIIKVPTKNTLFSPRFPRTLEPTESTGMLQELMRYNQKWQEILKEMTSLKLGKKHMQEGSQIFAVQNHSL
jgi:hypothetical protein